MVEKETGIHDEGMMSGGDGFIGSIMNSHPDCPKCELPMVTDESGSFFCASCEDTFLISDGILKKKLFDEGKGKLLPVIIVSSIVLFLLIFGAFGTMLYFHGSKDQLIDIDDISKIRGLEVQRDVPVKYMPFNEYDDHAQSKLDQDARRELKELERFYECMFVMDDGWDLVSLAENESAGGILGFYDTDTEEIYIIDGSNSDVYTNYILSHEFTHALQDQIFDLDSYYGHGSYDSDMARLCAIEGDAVLTMEIWADENLGLYDSFILERDLMSQMFRSGNFDELEYTNPIVSEMAYFPYEGGFDFVEEVYHQGGWGAVNNLYLDRPPLSTEQVLHIEKYIEYEPPEQIDIDLRGTDMEVVFQTSVGEKLIRELLPSIAGNIKALDENRTDLGWSGDRFIYLENGSDFMSIFVVEWDTEDHNKMFEWMFEELVSWHGDSLGNGKYDIFREEVHIISSGRTTYVLRSNSSEYLIEFGSTLGA